MERVGFQRSQQATGSLVFVAAAVGGVARVPVPWEFRGPESRTGAMQRHGSQLLWDNAHFSAWNRHFGTKSSLFFISFFSSFFVFFLSFSF